MDDNKSVVYQCVAYISKYSPRYVKIGWLDKTIQSNTLDRLYEELARIKALYTFSNDIYDIEVYFGKIKQIQLLGESNVSDAILYNTNTWKKHVVSGDSGDVTDEDANMFLPNHSICTTNQALPF